MTKNYQNEVVIGAVGTDSNHHPLRFDPTTIVLLTIDCEHAKRKASKRK